MEKTKAYEYNAIACSKCDAFIYTCDECEDYFEAGKTIYCKICYHLCESCGMNEKNQD